ncbi:MAG: translation initiation factor IF-2 [Chitinophagales bacterium]|nr:translation initiation factor IF-2 [Chitinophagales bacterium]
MAEIKLPRLLAAAKEFNIGQETLIDFLVKKGFNKDDLKPTAKLSEEMYLALQTEFQSDKAAKTKADQIEIPKTIATDVKKKKEEATIIKEEIKEENPKKQKKEEEKVEPIQTEEVVPEQTEPSIKIDAPEIAIPKIIDRIDLSTIDSSTKPKKSAKKKEEKPKKEKKEEEKTLELTETTIPETITTDSDTETISPSVIENIEVEKISGPKIVGKITLPIDSDTRPKVTAKEEQRKRKRIVVDKKPGSNIKHIDFRKEGDSSSAKGGSGGPQNRFGQEGRGAHHKNKSAGTKGRHHDNRRSIEKEIDAKEIQDKIKETQAKLAGASGRGKSLKAKYRREKRKEADEAMESAETTSNKLQVTEFVTVSELANLMNVSFTDVISKCMALGLMVSINQRLDAEVIELVASEFDFEVEFTTLDDVEEEEEDIEDNPEDLIPRSPIVTIMGHVDHGKTSLLDYIRNANVVAGEAGGITQHIGAYEVTLSSGKSITFLDTPGHEAFTAMRARGAKITDIAVIVIAADDAVMPQTKEAISHAQAANVPMIFAINKIDKEAANPQKIYEQLSNMNILVESWGGKYQSQELSAKKGLHVDELLEKILLEAELLELKANPNREASGTIIEASLDKGRGYVATILVQNGTLKQGDIIVSGQHYGRVKAMFNERNQRVQEAPPSTPVVILGLNGAPQAGEKFKVYEDEASAKEIATKRSQILREQGLRARKHITLDEIGRRLALGNFKELNIIIKGDVDGSVEALSDSLQKLSTQEIAINVVLKAVGQISESDVLLAAASDAILIGFNVRPSYQANKLAVAEGVQIKQYSIIYKAIEEIKSAMEGMLEPKVEEKEVASVEIREVFKFDKTTVAGCYVTEGKIKRDHKIKVFRDGILVFPRQEGAYAELGSLKRFKDDVKEVNNNYECGLTIKGFTDIQAGDTVVAYEEEEVKRTL